MFYIDQPDIFWLSVTNLLLGAIVLGCLAVLSCVVAKELGVRVRLRARRRRSHPELKALTKLGVDVDDEWEQPDERVIHPGRIPEKTT